MTQAPRVRCSYDVMAGTYADKYADELDHRPLERALLGAMPELAGPGLIADLGAGPAHVGRYLRDLGVATIALDLSPAMATIATHRNGVPAVAGSLTALPYRAGSLAGALLFFTLIHLDDDEIDVAVAEVTRALRPRGVALVSFHIGDEVVHVEDWNGHAVDLDFRYLEVGAVRRALEAAGLRVEAALERAPMPDVEAQTRRAYLLCRRE